MISESIKIVDLLAVRNTKGSESSDGVMIGVDTVPYASICNTCEVVGGCNDLDDKCQLKMLHGIRADGTKVRPKSNRSFQ